MNHPAICIELRPLEGQERLMPRRSRAPKVLPLYAPLPRAGELIYLSSTSAWRVEGVLHEWLSQDLLRVAVLIHHHGQTHHIHRPDFAVTQ
jgi:hypothetical protein